MFFEGSLEVFSRLREKQRLLREGNPLHETIRPVLLILSGIMRGVYAGGQARVLQRHGYTDVFDAVVGVSTGAPVAGYFVAGHVHEGVTIYWNECSTSDFLSLRRLGKGGPLMDTRYLANVFRGAARTFVRLNVEAITASRTALYTAVTCARTGLGSLLDAKRATPDVVEAIHASLAMPGLSAGPVTVNDTPYLDGAGAHPFPVEEVLKLGANDVLVLANCPEHEGAQESERLVSRLLFSSLTEAAAGTFRSRHDRFRDGLAYLRKQARCTYGIIWTDGLLSGFERNPKRLEEAAGTADHHLETLIAA